MAISNTLFDETSSSTSCMLNEIWRCLTVKFVWIVPFRLQYDVFLWTQVRCQSVLVHCCVHLPWVYTFVSWSHDYSCSCCFGNPLGAATATIPVRDAKRQVSLVKIGGITPTCTGNTQVIRTDVSLGFGVQSIMVHLYSSTALHWCRWVRAGAVRIRFPRSLFSG